MERSAIAFPAVAVSRGNSFLVIHAPESLERASRLAVVTGYYDALTLRAAGHAWPAIGD